METVASCMHKGLKPRTIKGAREPRGRKKELLKSCSTTLKDVAVSIVPGYSLRKGLSRTNDCSVSLILVTETSEQYSINRSSWTEAPKTLTLPSR